MGYHVDLSLTDDQVKQVKRLALDRNQSVTDLVTGLVIRAIEPAARGGKGGKKSTAPGKKA